MSENESSLVSEKIDSLLVNFDFETIHNFMKKNERKWFISGEMKLPEIPEMKSFCYNLLWRAFIDKGICASGGFEAIYFKRNDGGCIMGLNFQIASKWY